MSRNEDVARELAEAFRAEHGLDARPLGDLFELLHVTVGCDVIAMEADEAEHGLSMRDPDNGHIVIAVATTRHPMRQRSSAAHELGHVLAGDLTAKVVAKPGSRSPAEIRADAFARHLLLPVAALQARFGSSAQLAAGIDEAELAAVVQEFEVSPQLAAIQLKQAGLINLASYKALSSLTTAKLATRYGWLTQYKTLALASAQPRSPQELMRRAVEGYAAGVLGIAELASWYGQAPEDLREQLGDPARTATAGDHGDDEADEDKPLYPPGFRGAAAAVP